MTLTYLCREEEMSKNDGLRVVRVEPHYDDDDLIIRATVSVLVKAPPSGFEFDHINEDITMRLAEETFPEISKNVRSTLTKRWPGRSYSISWPMLLD